LISEYHAFLPKKNHMSYMMTEKHYTQRNYGRTSFMHYMSTIKNRRGKTYALCLHCSSWQKTA